MVSVRSKLFKFAIRRLGNMNPITNPGIVQRIIKGRSKPEKHASKKGYILEFKETENKSKYIVLKKDNKVEAKKVIYYMHGGAYIMKMISTYEKFCFRYCKLRDDVEVVLLDYSLAPENKYPTQLNEALDVWNELTKTFKPEDIIVGGDSSGGNLSLALILKLQKEQNISPKAGFFFSPDTDLTFSGKSFFDNYGKDILVGEKNATLTPEKWEIIKNAEVYISVLGDAERTDPYISPLFGDYTTFPRSIFVVGGNEMSLDDTLRVVEKIKANGHKVELINKKDMFHCYSVSAGFTPEAKETNAAVDKFIIESFEE